VYLRLWTARHITNRTGHRILRESERRFREILEHLRLIAVTIDNSGNITFCNDYLLSSPDGRGRKSWDETVRIFIPPELCVRDMFEEGLKQNQIPNSYSNEILTRSGERRLVEWTNTPCGILLEKIIGAASIGVDTTERTRSQEEISRTSACSNPLPPRTCRLVEWTCKR